MPPLTLRPIEDAGVPALAALLAERRREERMALPLLTERFADVSECEAALRGHLAEARCDGVVAERGGWRERRALAYAERVQRPEPEVGPRLARRRIG